MADTKREIEAPSVEELEFGDMITERRGAFWVVISVPSVEEDGGLNVKVDCGPVIGMDELKGLLRKTLEAL
jgi:hypothetical protein